MASDTASDTASQAIAVVGMACRFPGDATDIEAFWEMLRDGKDAWSPIPPERFNAKGWYHPDPNRPGSCHIKGAHFIKGDIAAFDAPFFSISTAEAVSMDPQQRMLLEVVYEALDSAGTPVASLANSATSVFCGSFVRDYEQPCMRDPDTTPPYSATGNGIAILANRVSHAFDFAGTSQTIDTGCSASMIAVHQACKSLLTGESDMGIAAGVGLIFSPNTLVPMANLNILGADGRCYTFDKRANGYGRGEGVGVIVLKRLADAIADNDTIRAVIRATSSNQDGHTQGITLPSKERQIQNMTAIYRNAGLDLTRTAYMECHGTGTQAGDVKEVEAVTEVFCGHRTADNPLLVGSVKTNIGHLEGSAGVAGLIKGILVVERGFIPKHLNFTSPNPKINFAAMKLKVATELVPWPIAGLRRASVNSFGFGGTNAHVVLDDAAHFLAETRTASGQHNTFLSAEDKLQAKPRAVSNLVQRNRLFVFSGHDEAGLARVLASQAAFLSSKSSATHAGFEANYAYTLLSRRSRLNWRTFVVASSTQELCRTLQEKTTAKSTRAPSHTPSRVALVFCGQGAQWHAMGRELLSYRIFHESLSAASVYMATVLGSPFQLLDELSRSEDTSRIHDPQLAQPATTALQVALVDLLVASGIQPTAVVGHSSGEIAAAYAAGALRREDAWAIAYHRGKCVAEMATTAPTVQGRMLAVAVSAADARKGIAEAGVAGVDVSCVNGPASVTLSGDATGIASMCDYFRDKNVRFTSVKVNTAYHSHHMRVVEAAYREALSTVVPVSRAKQGSEGPIFFSSVSDHAGRVLVAEDLGPDYWVQNLVQPVQFYSAVAAMLEQSRPDALLEVSPHRVWESTLQQIFDAVTADAKATRRMTMDLPQPTYVSLLHRKQDASVTTLAALGALWSQGFSLHLDWALDDNGVKPRHLVDVPSYPWDHSRKYWHESHLSKANRFRSHGREDIIGAPLENATPQDPRWRGFFRTQENPWLLDHVMQKAVIYPAGGMIAMAVEAGKQLADARRKVLGFELTNFVIAKPMLIPSTPQGLENMFSAHLVEGDADCARQEDRTFYDFSILSKPEEAPWTTHATGRLAILYLAEGETASTKADQFFPTELWLQSYKAVASHSLKRIAPRQFYETLDVIGMSYGPQFRNLVEIGEADRYAKAVVRVPNTKAQMPFQFEFDHIIHPATLDAMLQAVLACGGSDEAAHSAMLPCAAKKIFVAANPPRGAGAHFRGAASIMQATAHRVEAVVTMFDDALQSLAVLFEGLEFKAAPKQTDGGAGSSGGDGGFLPANRSLCSEIVWKQDLSSTAAVAKRFPSTVVELLDLAAHKNPALAVLFQIHADGDGGLEDKTIELQAARVGALVLGNLTRGYETPRFSQCLITGTSAEKVWERVRTDGGVRPGFDRVHASAAAPADELFDVAMYCLDAQQLSKDGILAVAGRVSADGWLVLLPDKDGPIDAVHQQLFCDTVQGAGFHVDTQANQDVGKGFVVAHKAQAQAAAIAAPKRSQLLLLLPDNMTPPIVALKHALRPLLETRVSAAVTEVRFSDIAALAEKDLSAPILSLVELDAPLVFAMDKATFAVLHRLLTRTKRMLWLTRGAQHGATHPLQAPMVGLARTLRSEDDKKKLILLDVEEPTAETDSRDDGPVMADPMCARSIVFLFERLLASAPQSVADDDVEFVLTRDGSLMIPRLMPLTALNRIVEQGPSSKPAQKVVRSRLLAKGRSLKLHAASFDKPSGAGPVLFVDDSESLHEPLLPTQVRIAVLGTNLLPEDLDSSSAHRMGTDVFGHVVQMGSDVMHLWPQCSVVARVRGAVRTHVVVDQSRVLRVKWDGTWQPSSLTAFLTAVYALRTSRRITKGDVVLVYGAGSAIGQMAIRLAAKLGAVVMAACSTSQEKQMMTQDLGMAPSHIVDLQKGDLPSMQYVGLMTQTRGANVVFDTTSRHLKHALSCVAECGRVIRVAWDGCAEPQFCPPAKNVSFETVDINLLEERQPFESERLSRDAEALLQLEPQLVNLVGAANHSMSDMRTALRDAGANVFTQPQVLLTASESNMVHTIKQQTQRPAVSPQGTYVLVGGLGGLGRSIAEHLVKAGAKHLAFLSRSGAESAAAKELLGHMRMWGVDAQAFAVDICDAGQLAATLAQMQAAMPPVQGAIQCAGVVADAAFPSMDYGQWTAAVGPKTLGSYNLHQQLPRTMDFFVFLSSSSGVMGNRGQANYAAGNSFQDALARHRSAQGLHSVSLDLGLVLGAGMVAENEALLDAMQASGFLGMRLADALWLVEQALQVQPASETSVGAQVVTTVGTGGLVLQNKPADPFWTRAALFRYLNQVDAPAHGVYGKGGRRAARDLRSAIRAAATAAATTSATGTPTVLDEAARVVSTALIATVARRKGMEPGDLDAEQALSRYGIDSLDAIFVLGWLARETGVTAQTVEGVTIAELSRDVARRVLEAVEEEEEEEEHE